MIKMFGDRRLELDPEDRRMRSNDMDIGWYSIWMIILCLALVSSGGLIVWVLIFYLPRLIFISLINPFLLLGIAVIFIFIVAVGSFESLIGKSFKSHRIQKIINDEKILIKATEKKISNFLHVNIANAYSKKALVKRLVEKAQHPYFKKYIKTNGEQALKRLVEEGIILTTQKDGETHYFTSLSDN